MKDLLNVVYAPANRGKLLTTSAVLILVIAVVDWWIEPYISLGFLYLFPIMLVGGFLRRTQIVTVALACAVLDFTNLPRGQTPVHLIFSATGFAGTGLFISELLRNRRMMTRKHLGDLMQLRREAEEQLRTLVESSPAAIVTIDASGNIVLANQAAEQLLAPDEVELQGQNIVQYLPALHTALHSRGSKALRTTMQCRGQRRNGETFLAGVWFSTYSSLSGTRLSAIIVDLSDDLRSREDLSLDHLLKSSRILMGAIAHEVRNLSSAMLVVQKNLSAIEGLQDNADFHALNTLIQSLESVAKLELRPAAEHSPAGVNLVSVLDEARVLIDSAYREAEMEVEWQIPPVLPVVRAEPYSLIQVFLNLARNSQRAMQSTSSKRLEVRVSVEDGDVLIHFADTGPGITNPEGLFRPFQRGAEATGLGLYMSRAMLRSFGGDLTYEPSQRGCCFRIVLHACSTVEESVHA